MATDDDAEPLNRLPWQPASRSAVRLKRITMIRIFRLRSAGFPCSVGNQQPRAGATFLLSGEDSAKLRPDHDACSFGSPDGPAARLLK